MADLVQTAANVVKIGTPTIKEGVAGAAITAGMPLYPDPADGNKLKPCDNSTAIKANAIGIATHPADNNQPILYQVDGEMNIGATCVVSQYYGISATSGKIAPIADSLVTTKFPSLLGRGGTGGRLEFILKPATLAFP